jgi:hypothetical protein
VEVLKLLARTKLRPEVLRLAPVIETRMILSRIRLVFSVFRIRIHRVRIKIQHFRLNNDPDPGF